MDFRKTLSAFTTFSHMDNIVKYCIYLSVSWFFIFHQVFISVLLKRKKGGGVGFQNFKVINLKIDILTKGKTF